MTELHDVEQEQIISIIIDGVPVPARPGELIIEAAERSGVFIPRFCYHPRMQPVGMCRMCLVEVSSPRGFTLQPSCYLRVADGQEIITDSEKARKAQEGVLELLLVNHPLDCPVCDKGGECPLQDQSMSHGPGESRFIEEKRHWPKPIDIGPLVSLDRERCIQCARCTRFAAEVAGEALIDFAFRGDEIEVAPFPLEPFSSYFAGNTVQICPVGALTSKPYRFKSRPWDLEQVESTCEGCAVGCRTVAQSSAGQLVRYLGIDVDAVNRSWLCDKGRYGFEAIYAETRLVEPLIAEGSIQRKATWNEALASAATALNDAKREYGPGSIAFIGGSRLTNEDAFAFAKLAKAVVGTDSVDAQLGDGLPAELVLGLPHATIDEASTAKAVIVLGQDLREELPVLFLRLREGAVAKTTAVIDLASLPTSMSPLSTTLRYLPGDLARAAALLVGVDGVDLQGIDQNELGAAKSALSDAGVGAGGEGLVVICGRGNLAESAAIVTSAAVAVNRALPQAKFLPTLRRANVHGALDMGLAPGVLPGRISIEEGRDAIAEFWGAVPTARGNDTISTLQAAVDGEVRVLVTLGADVLRDVPDRDLAQRALSNIPTVIAIATHRDATTDFASTVFPIAAEGERSGTVTNIEGRVAPVTQKIVPPGVAWPAWVVAEELALRLGGDLGFNDLAAIGAEIAEVAPAYRGLNPLTLAGDARHEGVVVPLSTVPVIIGGMYREPPLDPIATPGITSVDEQGAPIRIGATVTPPMRIVPVPIPARPQTLLSALGDVPLVTHPKVDAYSYRLVAQRSLYDHGTLVQANPSLAPLAEPLTLRVHPQELAHLGIGDGARVNVRSASGVLQVPVRADETLHHSVVVLGARNDEKSQPGAFSLIRSLVLATDVRLESV